MSYIKKSNSRRSEDAADDDSDDKDSKRKSRNLSEKKRRDQFNLLVNELSTMVATSGRKMDKSTVLKSTIAFLKNYNEVTVRSRINEIQEDWKPSFLTNEEFTHLVLEAVDGFIIVFSVSGQIFYASESIMSLLGHVPSDVLNMTIFELTNEEEHSNLQYNILTHASQIDGHVSFSCYLKRGNPESNHVFTYEYVNFTGYFRSEDEAIHSEKRYSGYSGEGDTRLVFIGTGKIQIPQLIREMSLTDSTKTEFISRHSLEWKFLFLDHRAPPIIGYLPFEVLGTSGYDYYHVDDLEKVIKCHEALMLKGEGTSCFYRFLTKGQQWIWLQTRFYITYHQWNSKPEFIVCSHRVVSYADIVKRNAPKDSTIMPLEENAPRTLWTNKNNKNRIKNNELNECVPMPADSPESMMSVITLKSASRHLDQNLPTSQSNHIPSIQHCNTSIEQIHQQNVEESEHHNTFQQAHQFLEPAQFIAAIPVPSVIAGYQPSAVLSPLSVSDNNIAMSNAQNQLQVDLQRKHAELQAIIDQQQAELKRVSEQLIMARLGLLTSQAQAVTGTPVSYSHSSSVSSTTTIAAIEANSNITSVIVPVTLPN